MLIIRCLLMLLVCAPLAAQHESNFGRVILAGSDAVAEAVASATRARVHSGFSVQLTVKEVLYGEIERREVTLFYTDPKLLKQDEAVHGLFALKQMAGGGFALVGKPVLTPEGDRESESKLRVCEEFIALEAKPAGDERTAEFWELLARHVRRGGYSAENAAIELMFIARDRASIITQERYDSILKARGEAGRQLTEQAKKDLTLAARGMVEAAIKREKFKQARRGETQQERRKGASDLIELAKEYPRAFSESDASYATAMAEDTDDAVLRASLTELQRIIRAEIRIREAREKEAAR